MHIWCFCGLFCSQGHGQLTKMSSTLALWQNKNRFVLGTPYFIQESLVKSLSWEHRPKGKCSI